MMGVSKFSNDYLRQADVGVELGPTMTQKQREISRSCRMRHDFFMNKYMRSGRSPTAIQNISFTCRFEF